MKKLFTKLKDLNQLPKRQASLSKSDSFLRGAFWGLLFFSLFIMAFAGFFFRTGLSPYWQAVSYVIVGILAFYVFRWLGTISYALFKVVPAKYISLILATIGVYLLARYMRLSWPQDQSKTAFALGITGAILIGGSIRSLFNRRGPFFLFSFLLLIGAFFLYLPISKILTEGSDPYPIEFTPYSSVNLNELGLKNPGEPGDYDFEYFTYGSGNDKKRSAFGNEVTYKTLPVDGSLMLPEWKGKKKKWRERYWGFGIDEAPINGRVWMPKKEGKLPLILIVHGNHGMEHYSDPGYAYLGELLASQGFITVSVDENFINGTWSGDFRGREMPIRAWLLLKHLEQWRTWSEDSSSQLFKRADLDNVMLMGHSRGGEAVSIAAGYNKLSYFPDNANVSFDFHFGIKGIVTIAPTDQRYFRRMVLKDINYLSLQGSYDADEASFFGLRQYQRISSSDSTAYFKAGILIHKANHGQFNSIWGRRDFGEPFGWFLNTGALISGEDQQKAAKIFISSFAQRVFNKSALHEEIFKNSASGSSWLPKTVYLNNYQNAHDRILFDFESDIDLMTGKFGSISTNGLNVWREEALKMRGGETQGTNAVIVGWESDSVKSSSSYLLTLDTSMEVETKDELIFSIGRASDTELKVSDTTEVDFTINLITSENDTIQTVLSKFKKIAPKLKVRYMKLDKMNGSFGGNWELAPETVQIPIHSITNQPFKVSQIEFLFDKTKKGLIALDNIGFRKPPE